MPKINPPQGGGLYVYPPKECIAEFKRMLRAVLNAGSIPHLTAIRSVRWNSSMGSIEVVIAVSCDVENLAAWSRRSDGTDIKTTMAVGASCEPVFTPHYTPEYQAVEDAITRIAEDELGINDQTFLRCGLWIRLDADTGARDRNRLRVHLGRTGIPAKIYHPIEAS